MEKVLESDLGKSQSAALSRIIGFDRNKTGRDNHLSDVIFSDADGLLNVEFSKRMLRWLAEAVGRSLELSTAADTYITMIRSTRSTLVSRIAGQKTSLYC